MLFNDAPTVGTIARIGAAHRRFGTTGFLPTLISDDLAVVGAAIEATRQAIDRGLPGVLGIHIEGPVPQRHVAAASTTPASCAAPTRPPSPC